MDFFVFSFERKIQTPDQRDRRLLTTSRHVCIVEAPTWTKGSNVNNFTVTWNSFSIQSDTRLHGVRAVGGTFFKAGYHVIKSSRATNLSRKFRPAWRKRKEKRMLETTEGTRKNEKKGEKNSVAEHFSAYQMHPCIHLLGPNGCCLPFFAPISRTIVRGYPIPRLTDTSIAVTPF